jgi:hypothetical protein
LFIIGDRGVTQREGDRGEETEERDIRETDGKRQREDIRETEVKRQKGSNREEEKEKSD